jgi:hypothetical protein
MTDWGIPFHVYEREWTEQQFQTMIQMWVARKQREQHAAKRGGGKRQPEPYR